MDFPTGTTAVLIDGKHVPLAEYLAGQGEEVAPSSPAPVLMQADYRVTDVAESVGGGHLTEVLQQAGFNWATDIASASEAELTAVSGIGKATATKLKTAAEEMLA